MQKHEVAATAAGDSTGWKGGMGWESERSPAEVGVWG